MDGLMTALGVSRSEMGGLLEIDGENFADSTQVHVQDDPELAALVRVVTHDLRTPLRILDAGDALYTTPTD